MWKKVARNSNYSISEDGQVRNDTTGRIKSPFLNRGNGYLVVDLYKDNRSTKVPIHRLVAEAFVPNPDGKPCVDHRDGNRKNNAISNLRWATYSENNSRFDSVGVRARGVRVTHYVELRKRRGGGHEAWLSPDATMHFRTIAAAAAHFECTQGNLTPLLKSGKIGRRGKMRGYLFEYED